MRTLIGIMVGLWITSGVNAQRKTPEFYNDLSEEFLIKSIRQEDTQYERNLLAFTPVDTLATYLNTDQKRIAFWVNIYNAYIQFILREEPESYEDKRRFFSADQIPFCNRMISFDRIEHGFLRKSQWKWGLGNIPTLFPPGYEKKLRVDEREASVHFVLNCGARSCPPVVLLQPETIDTQLDTSTRRFLNQTTQYDADVDMVYVTALFFWFRGDFGNKKGIRQLLAELDLIPRDVTPDLVKSDYDWTLDLDNHHNF